MSFIQKAKKLINRVIWELNFLVNKDMYTYHSTSGQSYLLHFRSNTSDRKVLYDIFFSRQYSFEHLARNADIHRIYDKILLNKKKPLIIDAGANIGASAIWFRDIFPESHIVAIEPEDHNFELLKQNTTGANIHCLHAAIGSMNAHAEISNISCSDNWSFQTQYETNGSVQVVSVENLIENNLMYDAEPFIIKIDIEGFESDLFSKNTDWIDRFYVIIIELHDWMLPGQGTSNNFLKSIAPKNRDFIQRADNIFSIKN